MIKIEQAERRLRKLLDVQGFDFEKPDISLGLHIFQQFMQEQVDCTSESITANYRVYIRNRKIMAVLSFVRMFKNDAIDKFRDQYEEFHLEFRHTFVQTLSYPNWYLSCSDYSALEIYFADVENSEIFQNVLAHSDWKCYIWQALD